jgi:hypothetical protein
VAFHVEIAGSLNHARAFNLSAEKLRRSILEPWLAERKIELGDHEWEPRKCTLRVLEGPELEPPELSLGQAWSNAERSAVDVTRRELEQAVPRDLPDAFIVATELPEATVAEMLSNQYAQPIPWGQALATLDGRDPDVAAVIIVTKR